jgi:predicted DNA-binding transcriptional regulator YafY
MARITKIDRTFGWFSGNAFNASSLVEIQRWILSWGGNAVVLEPPDLVHSIKESAKRIFENYK